MSLGYDTYEDNRSFEQDGLTGEVKRYATEGMNFPCYIINCDSEHTVEAFKIKVLKNMFSAIRAYDEEEAKLAISLYFHQGDKTAKLGQIYPKQVKSFLKLFESNFVEGYLSENKKLEGEYLYVLAE